MKKYFNLLLLFLSTQIFAQELPLWKKHLFIEGEILYIDGKLSINDNIRQNPLSDVWSISGNESVTLSSSGLSVGSRIELFHDPTKIGFSTGLRLKSFSHELNPNNKYFYYRYYQYETQTKFVRINNITDFSFYVCIPVEIRYIFFHEGMLYAFAKLGAEVGTPLYRDLEIEYKNPNTQTDYVKITIEREKNFVMQSFYGSFGGMIGKEGQLHAVFELIVPGLFTSSRNFDLINTTSFYGVRFSLQIPF